jgi:hypothetical protein
MFQFDADLLREGARPPDRPMDTSLDGRYATEILGWTPRSIVELAKRVPAAPAAFAL